jgi:signal transduction histidine kinase
MKRYALLLLCLSLFIIALFGTPVSADDSITLRVGIYENNPKIFTDENGDAAGFWPDIVAYIAAEEGWEIEYVKGTWAQCLSRLENNEIDIMPDVAYTEERAALYDFANEVVYVSWSRVYTREGVDIESVLDLEGKTVAVMQGSVNVEGPDGIKVLVSEFDVSCTFVEVDSYTGVFELVASGEADAGVASKDFGYQHGAEFNVVPTGIIFQPSLLYFAFPKDSSLTPYLIERIDSRVVGLVADKDSIYYQALSNWFGIEPAEKAVIPGWLKWALIGVGGLALLLGGGGLILRSQVRARTRELREEVALRQKAEDKLKKWSQELEERVQQRTQELEEMSRHKSQFLANMSHELRTPLNSIIGYTKLILDGLEGDINEEQSRDLQVVYKNSQHLLSLINDLLDISRIEAGKVTVDYQSFTIAELLEEVIPSVEQLAKEKGLTLDYSVAPDIDHIYADKAKTKQTLINIIGNAVKFTNKGGIKLDITKSDGEFVFSVRDTGVGIKKADLEVIFNSFRQVEPVPGAGYGGTGLGLAISKQFVEMQGGRIWAESRPGKGSTFTFTLPDKKAPRS